MFSRVSAVVVIGFMLVGATGAQALDAGNAEAGAKVFKKCQACHATGEGAVSKTGPFLTGVVGRPAGSIDGFSYSAGMKAKAGEGLVWTPENIAEFTANPKKFVPGTAMAFAGLKKDQEKADLIAYLASFP